MSLSLSRHALGICADRCHKRFTSSSCAARIMDRNTRSAPVPSRRLCRRRAARPRGSVCFSGAKRRAGAQVRNSCASTARPPVLDEDHLVFASTLFRGSTVLGGQKRFADDLNPHRRGQGGKHTHDQPRSPARVREQILGLLRAGASHRGTLGLPCWRAPARFTQLLTGLPRHDRLHEPTASRRARIAVEVGAGGR